MHFSLAGTVTAPNSAPLTVYSWEGFSDNLGTAVTAYTTVPTLAAGVTLYASADLISYYFNVVTDTFVYGNNVYSDSGNNQTIKGEYLLLTSGWGTTLAGCSVNDLPNTYYVGANAQYFQSSLAFSTWYDDPDFLVISSTFYYDPSSLGFTTHRVETDAYGYCYEYFCE